MVAAKDYPELWVCSDPSRAPTKPPAGATSALAWREVPKFGAKLRVPGDVTVGEHGWTAHLTNGTFKLNLFAVDERAHKSAAEAKASLENEPGFVKFTKEAVAEKTWHFEYDLSDGRTGTSARIDVGRPLDCGVHLVERAEMEMTSAACASAKPL